MPLWGRKESEPLAMRGGKDRMSKEETVKICVSSYSLSRPVQEGRITLQDAVDWLAEQGVKGIEFTDLDGKVPENEARLADDMVRHCAKHKLEITSYTVGANFLLFGEAQRAEVERMKRKVDIGARLGVKRMRHDVAWGFPEGYKGPKTWEAALKCIVPAVREVADYAARFGITTSTENHGYFAQASERVLKLVRAVNRPNYGVTLDIGNFLCVDENPVGAVRRLAKYASLVHAKDFHYKNKNEDPGEGWFRTAGKNYLRGAIVGHGVVDVRKCLALLKKAGYKGWVSVEFEGMEDAFQGVRIGLENLRRYLKQVK
jgi:sugar phosphate isomerase/epimerase